ncbi:MAG: amidohydrolase family protein, partial [Planctomycetota bacterium]
MKFRWGSQNPTDMFLEGKKSGIKFALGENVKQSRGQWPTSRYPRSRMGVEAIIRDRFIAAQEYAADPNARRDLELEALAEILAGERLVHCHSYRQDEILMLCRVAEDFGFKIGSFQHGLEVYKVAEAVKEHALGASIFSDWWVFKIEVGDAIPFAGPLQTEAGVLTSFNSDSDNLARRMNIEAAKAVKYSRKDANGDPIITPAEALKFVTINPAIQLGIDNRVGSLEQGKDADFVVWSGDPLSTLSVPEHVFIDGREYFSLEQDRAHRERNTAERKRIIQKILANPKKKEAEKDDGEEGDASDAPSARESILARYYLRRLDNDGLHPGDMKPGECGCMVLDHDL